MLKVFSNSGQVIPCLILPKLDIYRGYIILIICKFHIFAKNYFGSALGKDKFALKSNEPRRCFFCGSFLLFVFCLCHTEMSVSCSLLVTCSERADLLAFLCVMFSCVFVTSPFGVLGQV